MMLSDAVDTTVLTAMGYRSRAERPAEAVQPAAASATGRLLLHVPRPADFATRGLAIGIGIECSGMIEELASASWFAHLRRPGFGPCCSTRQAGQSGSKLLRLIGSFPPPHVASIALPAAPTSAEVDLAQKLGRRLRRKCGAFVVMTAEHATTEMLSRLSKACDCFVEGDGGLLHHHYPIRTVSDPVSGRLVCYDTYDVCSMWAGRRGEYGVFRPAADALHVELSAKVTTLQEANDLAAGYGTRLSDPGNLKLFNVVGDAALPDATPISFRHHPLICQDRSPKPGCDLNGSATRAPLDEAGQAAAYRIPPHN